jgi:hypothetical protein
MRTRRPSRDPSIPDMILSFLAERWAPCFRECLVTWPHIMAWRGYNGVGFSY